MRLEKTVLLVVALVVGMGGTANAQGSCSTYPLVWAPAANAQADAQTDLTSIANPFLPAPSMNWSTPRGTFTSVGSLDYVFPSCASGTNVSAALFTLAGTVPDLLPIASGEWT